MKVAVVGVTGLVGTRMLEVLEERHFPVTELLPVASERSVGRKVTFGGKEYTVISADEAIAAKPELAIFSAGGGPSKELAPRFAAVGCRVVDNSSCWRMDPTKKLVVPEVNADKAGRLKTAAVTEFTNNACGCRFCDTRRGESHILVMAEPI